MNAATLGGYLKSDGREMEYERLSKEGSAGERKEPIGRFGRTMLEQFFGPIHKRQGKGNGEDQQGERKSCCAQRRRPHAEKA
jgi:hypothetical protein